MIDIDSWMQLYQASVTAAFGERIQFIGLQGSYGRGEANENSDIDVVLILDEVSLADLKEYKRAIAALPSRQLICGFVSGKNELANWHKADLFQFYHDTIPMLGDLKVLLPPLSEADTRNAISIGACTLYHQCSHNFLHDEDSAMLKGMFKSAFFILQAKYFLETGKYVKSHTDLKSLLNGEDLMILEAAEQIKMIDITPAVFEENTAFLLPWSAKLICS